MDYFKLLSVRKQNVYDVRFVRKLGSLLCGTPIVWNDLLEKEKEIIIPWRFCMFMRNAFIRDGT